MADIARLTVIYQSKGYRDGGKGVMPEMEALVALGTKVEGAFNKVGASSKKVGAAAGEVNKLSTADEKLTNTVSGTEVTVTKSQQAFERWIASIAKANEYFGKSIVQIGEMKAAAASLGGELTDAQRKILALADALSMVSKFMGDGLTASERYQARIAALDLAMKEGKANALQYATAVEAIGTAYAKESGMLAQAEAATKRLALAQAEANRIASARVVQAVGMTAGGGNMRASELAAMRRDAEAVWPALDGIKKRGGAIRNIFSQLAGTFRHAFAGLVAFAAIGALAQFTRSLVDIAKEGARIQATLRSVTGSTAAAGREMKFVAGVAENLGLDLRQTASGYARLAASAYGAGVSTENLHKGFIGLADAFTAFGLSGEQANHVLVQLDQGFSLGVLHMRDIRAISNSLPNAMELISEAVKKMGGNMKDMLANGGIPMLGFFKVFTQELRDKYAKAAQQASHTLIGALNKLHTNLFLLVTDSKFTETLTDAFNRLNKALSDTAGNTGLKRFIDDIGKTLDGAITAVAFLTKHFNALLNVVEALGTYLITKMALTVAWGWVSGATLLIASLTKGIKGAKEAMAAFNLVADANPIGVIALLVGGGYIALKHLIDNMHDLSAANIKAASDIGKFGDALQSQVDKVNNYKAAVTALIDINTKIAKTKPLYASAQANADSLKAEHLGGDRGVPEQAVKFAQAGADKYKKELDVLEGLFNTAKALVIKFATNKTTDVSTKATSRLNDIINSLKRTVVGATGPLRKYNRELDKIHKAATKDVLKGTLTKQQADALSQEAIAQAKRILDQTNSLADIKAQQATAIFALQRGQSVNDLAAQLRLSSQSPEMGQQELQRAQQILQITQKASDEIASTQFQYQQKIDNALFGGDKSGADRLRNEMKARTAIIRIASNEQVRIQKQANQAIDLSNQSMLNGIKGAWADFGVSALDLADQTRSAFTNLADGIAGSFADLAVSGKASFKELAVSFVKSVDKMIIKFLIFKAISGIASFFTPGAAPLPSSASINFGTGQASGLFAGLKFATGGIVPGFGNSDSVPAMLTPGEGVFTRAQMARLAPVSHRSGDFNLSITYQEQPGKTQNDRQQDQRAFTRQIKSMVQQIMIEDVATNGPVSRSYQSSLGLQRTAVAG